MAPKIQLAGDLMTAIALLPYDHYVKFDKELLEDDDEEMLCACVFLKAPKSGWPSRGARFHHPADAPSHQEPCPPQWKYEDCVLFGVNSLLDEPEILERLLINAIHKQWGQT